MVGILGSAFPDPFPINGSYWVKLWSVTPIELHGVFSWVSQHSLSVGHFIETSGNHKWLPRRNRLFYLFIITSFYLYCKDLYRAVNRGRTDTNSVSVRFDASCPFAVLKGLYNCQLPIKGVFFLYRA